MIVVANSTLNILFVCGRKKSSNHPTKGPTARNSPNSCSISNLNEFSIYKEIITSPRRYNLRGTALNHTSEIK